MFVRPDATLFVAFRVIVLLLPLLMFVAPGTWRNICPLTAPYRTGCQCDLTLGLFAN